MSRFDVWVLRFEPAETSPAERLEAAFGIDAKSAAALERSVPKIVKHGLTAKAAGEMRQALEAIGAVVECRPARVSKPAPTGGEAAVFRAPDEDLLAPGRVSAIDPFSPATDASVPRISVDEVGGPELELERVPRGVARAAPSTEQPSRGVSASLLATSQAQQRRVFLRQALGSIGAGVAIVAIGWFLGGSVFRGEAGWVGIGFDGLGIYFIGGGLYELVTTLRS